MRAIDVIYKKREGFELSKDEIVYFIKGYIDGSIPDYQMSSFLMAVYFKGMTSLETSDLTLAMIDSGETFDLSKLSGIKVDKHSTGGVGDKVSFLVAPVAAACGVYVPMMAGRGLGHTGGTIDKLESITGYKMNFTNDEALDIMSKCNYVIMAQTDKIVPADKRMYALRDVTATVESIPLITASIMSKKFAEGADCLVMDVKCGSGAFMKNIDDAKKLAGSIVNMGKVTGKKIIALITDMNLPLGEYIGNYCEIMEIAKILSDIKIGENGSIPGTFRISSDLIELSIEIASYMVLLGRKASDLNEAKKMVIDVINNRSALHYFYKNIEIQGGNIDLIKKYSYSTKFTFEIKAEKEGFIEALDAYKFGMGSMIIGAGRKNLADKIDYSTGIRMNKKIGDPVKKDETIAEIYYNDKTCFFEAINVINEGIKITNIKPVTNKIIYEIFE